MILLIISTILFLALVAISFISNPKKLMILSACVCLLIVCNFINQLQAINEQGQSKVEGLVDTSKMQVKNLGQWEWSSINNSSYQLAMQQMLEEQKQMTNLLLRRWQDYEFMIINFKNLHKNRLKLVLDLMKHRANITNQAKTLQFYMLDYKSQSCDMNCLQLTFKTTQQQSQPYKILVVDNLQHSKDLDNLQDIYKTTNITIIFQTLPKYFSLSTISRFTYIQAFSNNYLPKLLEHHPSKAIQYCSSHHTFDYNFYVASHTTPLLQLCSKSLPSSAASRCVRKLIQQQKGKVPQGWVRKCRQEGLQQGLIQQNGWISLKKEYYWSGRVNTTEYGLDKVEL